MLTALFFSLISLAMNLTGLSTTTLAHAEHSAWVAVEGKVYDVTGFLDDVSVTSATLSLHNAPSNHHQEGPHADISIFLLKLSDLHQI